MSNFIQVFDNDLHKQLTFVESLVEEKILKQAEKLLLMYDFELKRGDSSKLLAEIKNSLFGESAHLAHNFIYHVKELLDQINRVRMLTYAEMKRAA
jgi:hypothetical protein